MISPHMLALADSLAFWAGKNGHRGQVFGQSMDLGLIGQLSPSDVYSHAVRSNGPEPLAGRPGGDRTVQAHDGHVQCERVAVFQPRRVDGIDLAVRSEPVLSDASFDIKRGTKSHVGDFDHGDRFDRFVGMVVAEFLSCLHSGRPI